MKKSDEEFLRQYRKVMPVMSAKVFSTESFVCGVAAGGGGQAILVILLLAWAHSIPSTDWMLMAGAHLVPLFVGLSAYRGVIKFFRGKGVK